MKPSAIFIDVDEVLADWLTPTLRLLGFDPADVAATWSEINPRPWDVFEVLRVSPDRAWRAIDEAGSQHWADLALHPWSMPLYRACKDIAPTFLLTSPSLASTCASGKVEWMQRHFGRSFRDFLIGPAKHACARPGALLIDDSPRNCERFVEHGGHAIVFPGLGNDLHEQRDRPLAHVFHQLNLLTAPRNP